VTNKKRLQGFAEKRIILMFFKMQLALKAAIIEITNNK